MRRNPNWNDQFYFIDIPKNLTQLHGISNIIKSYLSKKKIKFINYIESKGLETRPIISGSFTNQPSSKLFKLNVNNQKFNGAEIVQKLGFVIGLHTKNIDQKRINFITKTLLSIDTI